MSEAKLTQSSISDFSTKSVFGLRVISWYSCLPDQVHIHFVQTQILYTEKLRFKIFHLLSSNMGHRKSRDGTHKRFEQIGKGSELRLFSYALGNDPLFQARNEVYITI